MTRRRKTDIEADFLHLARIALSGRSQDVQVVIHRIAKRYRSVAPDLAEALTTLLLESPTPASPLRHSELPLPVDVDTRLRLMRVEANPILEHEPVFAPDLGRAGPDLPTCIRGVLRSTVALIVSVEPWASALVTRIISSQNPLPHSECEIYSCTEDYPFR